MKVLIVDDEKEIADYICQLVDEVTFSRAETAVFYSGTKALDRLQEERFDLIISDIVMPITDGLAILEYVAAKQKDVRFIFLTVHKEFDYIYRANKLKKIDYIMKTETVKEIKRVIEKNVQELTRASKKLYPLPDGSSFTQDEGGSESAIVGRICEHIRKSSDSELNVNTLAARFHYHPSYLSKLFKKHLHLKLSDYILEQKLERARRYLTETEYTVGKISSLLGYQSAQAFGRMFREKVGVTPQEYRRKNG